MKKDTFYFSHDYNSRSDPRMIKLSMKQGMAGIGIYWCIVEMLYEQGGYLPLSNIESIAFELHSECDRIKDVLQNYELFIFEDEMFYSESALRRLNIRNDKSNKARESANKRWNDANAMRTQSEGNAIKESKVKKKKENNIKDFDLFWDSYHSVTGLNKSDKEAALKYWNKLNPGEQQKAINNVPHYFSSLKDKQYCKKARTYLADKNFNDEFVKVPETPKAKQRELDPKYDLIPNPNWVEPIRHSNAERF